MVAILEARQPGGVEAAGLWSEGVNGVNSLVIASVTFGCMLGGMIFGLLIFLGYCNSRLGILGALGSIVTFVGTTTIIPFLPDAWAKEAGGFPIMTLPAGFLMKDVLFLVVSFYLLKQDLARVSQELASAADEPV